MKFVILTQYYPPEHGAPQNRLHDLARRWVETGNDVTVMTAMPNYPQGKVFPDYRGKFSDSEVIDGVKVVRSAIWLRKKKSTINQLIAYFSFVFTSLLVGIFKLGNADFLICESPPLFLGFSALLLSFSKRYKLIMNISDLWPESAVQLGMLGPGPALSILEWFEKLLYQKSVLVSCQTEGIVAGVTKRYPEANSYLLPNGVDLDMFPVVEKNIELAVELQLDTDKFIVGYGGNHGRSQALGQILDAAEILKETGNPRIQFVLFGDGPEKEDLQQIKAVKELENVTFYPSQPREMMAKVQSLWDIALVPLKDIELFDGARPSKMFELMAGEIPFIFCGKGEGAELAGKSGSAVIVPSEKPRELVDAICVLAESTPDKLKKMGGDGRDFVKMNFNRKKIAEDLLEELKKL